MQSLAQGHIQRKKRERGKQIELERQDYDQAIGDDEIGDRYQGDGDDRRATVEKTAPPDRVPSPGRWRGGFFKA